MVRRDPLIAIGASTGGTEAIAAILSRMPADAPPLVIVQHMPKAFTAPFAQRCDVASPLTVTEARDGHAVRVGAAIIARGDCHMRVERTAGGYVVRLDGSPPVNHHRPSVDVLFASVAVAAGPLGVGLLLTGMGTDGARGLLAMRSAGARTIAQDEHTSVVFGMPREAIRLGAAERVLPLARIADTLLEFATSLGGNPGRSLHAVER
jgi:two-component system chemotaxis response regulator CheB